MNTLDKATVERIEAEAAEYARTYSGLKLIKRCYIAGATAEALRYQYLLRFAGVPELIIANPDFIKGKKPTDEDMEWAMQKVEEFQTYEQGLQAKYKACVEALEKIANPLKHLQYEAMQKGEQLNGVMAIQLSNDANWLKSIATTALNNLK